MDEQNSLSFYPAGEAVIPSHFPKVYVSRSGYPDVYLGVIYANWQDMELGCRPYWAEGMHSFDEALKKEIVGFYKLKGGYICKARFLDEKPLPSSEVAEPNVFVELPNSVNTGFGICDKETRLDDEELTRVAFGLTYDELSAVLDAYGLIFGLGNIYQRFPRITGSVHKSNCCDLSNAWIPKEFPYITFDASNRPFSHVSLGAFYDHMRLLLKGRKRSILWSPMLKAGVSEDILERIMEKPYMLERPVQFREFLGLI